MNFRTYEKTSHGVWHLKFDSVRELVEQASAVGQGAPGCNLRVADWHANGDDDHDFFNGMNARRAAAEVVKPNRVRLESIVQMRELIEQAVIQPRQVRRVRRVNQEYGETLDPVAVVQRDPAGWSRIDRQRAPKRRVRVAVNSVCPFFYTPEQVLWRGAAAAALADVLTRRGFAVEVIGFAAATGLSPKIDRHVSEVTVKRSDAPLDLGALALCLGEIGFFRTIVLSAQARCADERVAKHMGRPTKLPASFASNFDAVADTNITTREAACKWILETVEALNK